MKNLKEEIIEDINGIYWMGEFDYTFMNSLFIGFFQFGAFKDSNFDENKKNKIIKFINFLLKNGDFEMYANPISIDDPVPFETKEKIEPTDERFLKDLPNFQNWFPDYDGYRFDLEFKYYLSKPNPKQPPPDHIPDEIVNLFIDG